MRPRTPHDPRPRALTRLVAVLGAATLLACAGSPTAKMSFAEAGLAGDGAPVHVEDLLAADAVEPDAPAPPPPVAIPAPESIASEAADGPPIDSLLVRFAAEARTRRGQHPAARGFPPEAARAWQGLAAELDRYLGRALPQTPLLELVRARVTVEAEWDYDVRRYGPPPPALRAVVESRARRFATRISTARALGVGLFVERAPARLRWPIAQAGISSLFGMRNHPLDGRRRMHHGVDLASAAGRVVGSAARGWVVRAGWMGGYGLMVEVRHDGGLTTRYGHLSALLCAPGDEVAVDQPLGLVGRTGRATGPHLHFEVWRGGEPSDPLAWLGLVAADGAGN